MRHSLIPAAIAEANITQAPRELHMEVMNLQTRDVWVCQQPITEAQFKALKVNAPLMKVGYGRAAFDFAYFRRSPGAAEDGALETTIIDGLGFARVARPQQLRGFAAGDAATQMMIEKHHIIGFDAGSELRLARLPDGQYYLQQTVSASATPDVDPEDWQMYSLKLAAPWSVELSCPAAVYFFRNLRSYTGPFTARQLPGAPQPLNTIKNAAA